MKNLFSIIADWVSGKVAPVKPVKVNQPSVTGTGQENKSTATRTSTGTDTSKGSTKTSGSTVSPGTASGAKSRAAPAKQDSSSHKTATASGSGTVGSFAPLIGFSKGTGGGAASSGRYGFGYAGAKVIIKANFFRGTQKANAHLKYIEHRQYDERSELFGQDRDNLDRRWFIDNLKKYDVIHRIVISPKDKDVDLKELVRETMEQYAKKKNRELTWIAAIHKNPEHTSHPHVHLVLSGADKHGRKVRIEMPDIEYLKKTTSEFVSREKSLFNAMDNFFTERERKKEKEKEQGMEL